MTVRDLPLREYWRDTKRASVWAVEIQDGQVVRCCGPLSLGEAELDEELLDTLDYSKRRAAWIRSQADRFRPWEPSHEAISPT